MAEYETLVLDCRDGSRKATFAKGLMDALCDKEAFLARTNVHLAPIGVSVEDLLKGSAQGCASHDSHHAHEHEHHHDHHSHDAHDHHSLDEVHSRIDSLELDEDVVADVFGVYDILATAEAKAHNVDVADVHFHEVGNTEAIGCIALSCLAMQQLIREYGISDIKATPICTGFGFVDCAHGRLPIPAPATANVLAGVMTFTGDVEGELTTPTGAALVRFFAGSFDAEIPDANDCHASEQASEGVLVCKVG